MTDTDRELLIEDVKAAEGYRARAYQDSVGVWTIGYGTNLQDLEIDRETAERWCLDKLEIAEAECQSAFVWFEHLTPRRQRVLVEMTYNLGMTRLRGFHQTLAAIRAGDYDRAASQMLQSLWARQVGKRAIRLANMMREG
jgi:lysozyme